jgi:uncharacterized protein (UPF0548 family)
VCDSGASGEQILKTTAFEPLRTLRSEDKGQAGACPGYGHQLFAAAGDAARQWQVQLEAGLQVSASSPTAMAGTVLLLGLEIGSLRLRAPCRVVYAVDEPRRRGFAYGTLAGHPESGEEAFMIEHHDDDSVSFRITAFSRPATRLATIAGPLGAVVQRQITAAYLRSLAKIAVQ